MENGLEDVAEPVAARLHALRDGGRLVEYPRVRRRAEDAERLALEEEPTPGAVSVAAVLESVLVGNREEVERPHAVQEPARADWHVVSARHVEMPVDMRRLVGLRVRRRADVEALRLVEPARNVAVLVLDRERTPVHVLALLEGCRVERVGERDDVLVRGLEESGPAAHQRAEDLLAELHLRGEKRAELRRVARTVYGRALEQEVLEVYLRKLVHLPVHLEVEIRWKLAEIDQRTRVRDWLRIGDWLVDCRFLEPAAAVLARHVLRGVRDLLHLLLVEHRKELLRLVHRHGDPRHAERVRLELRARRRDHVLQLLHVRVRHLRLGEVHDVVAL